MLYWGAHYECMSCSVKSDSVGTPLYNMSRDCSSFSIGTCQSCSPILPWSLLLNTIIILIWPLLIKFDHGNTSWLSCLFDCCSVVCGCRDWCGSNNLCRKSRICVWSLVCCLLELLCSSSSTISSSSSSHSMQCLDSLVVRHSPLEQRTQGSTGKLKTGYRRPAMSATSLPYY